MGGPERGCLGVETPKLAMEESLQNQETPCYIYYTALWTFIIPYANVCIHIVDGYKQGMILKRNRKILFP